MGYACPVCGVPQRDGEHLANHVAFTAMLHHEDHEAWLDEHVPDWSGSSPAALADEVVRHAEEAEYDEVFEDTVHDHGGDRSRASERGRGDRPTDIDYGTVRGRGVADGEVEPVLREARELTAEMYDESDSAESDAVAEGAVAEDAVETTNDGNDGVAADDSNDDAATDDGNDGAAVDDIATDEGKES